MFTGQSSTKLGVVNSNRSASFESLRGPGIAQIGAKKQIANELVVQLQKVGIGLSGSTILDVGFGFGLCRSSQFGGCQSLWCGAGHRGLQLGRTREVVRVIEDRASERG